MTLKKKEREERKKDMKKEELRGSRDKLQRKGSFFRYWFKEDLNKLSGGNLMKTSKNIGKLNILIKYKTNRERNYENIPVNCERRLGSREDIKKKKIQLNNEEENKFHSSFLKK